MKNIYAGIELGTDSIKFVVVEKINDKYSVLASTSSKSLGIRDGEIVDVESSVKSVKDAIDKVDRMLGLSIKKVIAAVPPVNCKMDIVVGSVDVVNKEEITGVDVSNVLNDGINGHELNDYEIITASPISFTVDDKDNIADPKGLSGNTLEAKIVISSIPKSTLYKLLEVINLSGLETIDVAYTSTGDYFACNNDTFDSLVGAVINIGEVSTNISVFNKGIQIKHELVPIGSNNVDKDLSYIYKVSYPDARNIKENFAMAIPSIADEDEIISVTTTENEKVDVTQVDASKVVEARLKEILKLSKNTIKNLTNREISYIIVTGGLSEISGFSNLVDEEFGGLAKVCKLPIMGIRHNKYSSTFGLMKYFDSKLKLRGRIYNMMDRNMHDVLTTNDSELARDVSSVFSHLFD